MKSLKRKNILFVRHFGVISNLGDQLISKATEEHLQRLSHIENFQYETASFVPYTKFGKFNFNNLIKGFFFSLKQAVKAEHIVIIGGNLIIPNNTKFSLCFFFYFLLSRVFKTKLSTFGVGVSLSKGNKTWRNWLYKKSLLSADYIGVRDEHSFNALTTVMEDDDFLLKGNVHLSHDCAFLFKDKYFSQKGESKKIAIIPVNYNSATCNESVIGLSESEYLDFHVNLVSAMIRKGMKPFFLCTDLTDQLFAEKINQKFNLVIITPKSVGELFMLLNSINVIAARMHGIIASLLAGSFVVALNWQHKVKSLSKKELLAFPCYDFDEKNIAVILDELTESSSIKKSNLLKISDELCSDLQCVIHQ
jgi:polysaccharide pyruvyl transferase WcaK-like protein